MSSNIDAFEAGLRELTEITVAEQIAGVKGEMEFAAITSCVDLTPVRSTGPQEGRGRMKASWRVRRTKYVTWIRNVDFRAYFVDHGTVRTRAHAMVGRTVEMLKARFG